MPLQFDLTAAPDEADLAVLRDGLIAFNDADVGPSGKEVLTVFVRDDDGRVCGGLAGHTGWGWLYIQWLWLAEGARGKGLAGRLLAIAEDEALRRGCLGAHIDTFSPTARKVYERAGYQVFGELPDFPRGRTRYFLKKRLGA